MKDVMPIECSRDKCDRNVEVILDFYMSWLVLHRQHPAGPET